MKMKIQALYLTGAALLIGAAGVGDSVTFDTVGSWTGAVILAVLLAAGGIGDGGTTITGCQVLEEMGFRAAAINAVQAATNKSREL